MAKRHGVYDRYFAEIKKLTNNAPIVFELEKHIFLVEERRQKAGLRILKGESTAKLRYCTLIASNQHCLRCGCRIYVPDRRHNDPQGYECDHVKDVGLGGRTEWGNMQPLCRACNQLKCKARDKGDDRILAWDFRDRDPEFRMRMEAFAQHPDQRRKWRDNGQRPLFI